MDDEILTVLRIDVEHSFCYRNAYIEGSRPSDVLCFFFFFELKTHYLFDYYAAS